MKVETPLLERACRRFPIDSEQITGMRYITDDFIEFDMFRVGSLGYLHSDEYPPKTCGTSLMRGTSRITGLYI